MIVDIGVEFYFVWPVVVVAGATIEQIRSNHDEEARRRRRVRRARESKHHISVYQ